MAEEQTKLKEEKIKKDIMFIITVQMQKVYMKI